MTEDEVQLFLMTLALFFTPIVRFLINNVRYNFFTVPIVGVLIGLVVFIKEGILPVFSYTGGFIFIFSCIYSAIIFGILEGLIFIFKKIKSGPFKPKNILQKTLLLRKDFKEFLIFIRSLGRK